MATTTDEFYQYCVDNVFNDTIGTQYIHWFLIPAVIIVAILSFAEKRKTYKREILGGRLALIRPLGFLDEPNNRWGVMFVFGSVTGNIISIAMKALSDELNWPIWAKIFMVYILCLEISVICYPLFACMTSRHKLLGAITGLLYSIGWFIFEMFENIQIGRCYAKFTNPDLGVNIAAHILIQEAPVYICDFLVILKFSWKLYKSLKKGVYKISHEEQVKLCRPYHIEYVKHLIDKHQKPDDTNSLTFIQKWHRKIVRPVPGFRFPISVSITTFMSAVMLFMVGLYCAEFMEIQAKSTFPQYEHLMKAANVIATIITILCGIRNIYLFLLNYKRDILLMYKGDRSFVPNTVQTPSPNVYMAQGMRFIGTSITGMLWGTVFCYLLVFVPLAAMMMVTTLLKERGKLDDMFKQFQWLIYPVCMILIFKLQVFLIGRFFIQPKLSPDDKFRPLAVDNRNAYDVFSFFMVFLNASIGLFTFLKRILVGAFLGVFLIPRMDRSLLMRGYEAMDKCYVNYIGMIMVDVTHNHPVMRVFCYLVKAGAETNRDKKPLQSAVDNAEYCDLSFSQHIPVQRKNNQARRRWWLAMTLIRNPSLVPLRVRLAKCETLRSTLDISDIHCSDKIAIVDNNVSEDTFRFSFRCCRNYKLKIPPNLVINVLAFTVLLSVLFLYTGLPLLLNELGQEAAEAAAGLAASA